MKSEESIESLDQDSRLISLSTPTKLRPPKETGRPIRVINITCQSLVCKKGTWRNSITTTRLDIHVVIATETWLNPAIGNADLKSHVYAIFRKYRTFHGGGVLIAVNSVIRSTGVSITTTAEIIWVWTHCKSHRDIFIASCYCLHLLDSRVNSHLRASLNQVMGKKRTGVVIVAGDFSFPGWNWSKNSLKQGARQRTLHYELPSHLVYL